MAHTLYVIHGSHPCVCAERALQLKGQPYRIVELPPALHVPAQWLRFRKTTVPALVLGSG
jgi:glutathione S-transferase